MYYENDSIPCFSGGHIHVGGQIDWITAREAAEIPDQDQSIQSEK